MRSDKAIFDFKLLDKYDSLTTSPVFLGHTKLYIWSTDSPLVNTAKWNINIFLIFFIFAPPPLRICWQAKNILQNHESQKQFEAQKRQATFIKAWNKRNRKNLVEYCLIGCLWENHAKPLYKWNVVRLRFSWNLAHMLPYST